MDYKPGDLFVGLVDFFAIVLPGAMLTFLCSGPMMAAGNATGLRIGDTAAGWVAFVLCSYLLGQFIQLVAARYLDRAYDRFYRPGRTGSGADKKIKDALYERAGALAGEFATGRVLKWTRAYVRMKSAEASAELDRLEATSKFFRGVFVVLVGYFFTLMLRPSTSVGTKWFTVAAIALLLVLSFWRFCEQRWKFTEATYLYFIELHTYSGASSENAPLTPTASPRREAVPA